MRNSLYWDDFTRRAEETIAHVKAGTAPPVRRAAVFVTDRCNFKCAYCNHCVTGSTMSQATFEHILTKYGDSAILHITGGEPSVVPWLYPFLREYGHRYRFHLNTNAFIEPPAEFVQRLKISLDSKDAKYWNCLVGRDNAFATVLKNLKEASDKTVTSVTYTVTKENYNNAVDFTKFIFAEAPHLYAVFFSIYKGTDARYSMQQNDVDVFFGETIPHLYEILPDESAALLRETVDEKRRLIQGVRFEQEAGPCYLSMSERVFSPTGEEFTCSHLYRDKIYMTAPVKCDRCKYGCNQRLVQFNDLVARRLRK